MVELLATFGAEVTVDDVRRAFLLGLKIGRADATLSRPRFDFDDLDS